MRWILIATHVPPNGEAGGMVRYAVEFASAMAARADVRLEVVAAEASRGFFIDRLGLPESQVHGIRGSIIARSIAERVGRLGVELGERDVVHGTKHLLPRVGRSLMVMTVHDLLPLDRPRDFSLAKRFLLTPNYLASVGRADVLACVSDATRQRLVARAPASAPRAGVVPLALSSSLMNAVPRAIPALADRPFALVVGDASRRKNLRFVASIWAAAITRLPDACLAVVGPAGWGRENGLEELAALEQQGRVVRLGHVDDGELRWAYGNARVVLCPSLLEGFGLPALEAVTFGAPVVASPDPAMVEAAGGRSTVVALDDPRGWLDAVTAAWRRPREAVPAGAARQWGEVADETVALAREASRRRR